MAAHAVPSRSAGEVPGEPGRSALSRRWPFPPEMIPSVGRQASPELAIRALECRISPVRAPATSTVPVRGWRAQQHVSGRRWPLTAPTRSTAVPVASLVKDDSARGWSESAWDGGGSGCSAFEAKPAFQRDTGCAHRTVADVSAVADPDTGVAVYNGGWHV
jgi:hypothetical protein